MVYENKQDWPEKYDINKLVSIQDSIDKIISGEKVSERRNDRYADPGDELLLDGHLFIAEDVYPQQLKNLTEKEAKDEGYKNLEEYKKTLTRIHHGAVWEPERVVWAHYLKEK
jgi:hypothetical protein